MMKSAFVFAFAVFFSIPAFAQSADFCNEVNAKREFCKMAKVDCQTLMNGDLDAATLDTIDLIKGCAPAKPTAPVSTPPKHPEIGNYPCCVQQRQ
jgi:hypothetical protein